MAQILRVSYAGTLPGGEEWSVNPVFGIGGDFGVPVSAAQALSIATAIGGVTMATGIAALMNGNTFWSSVRVEARSMAGELESQGEFSLPAPRQGTGAQNHPYQTCSVVSLRTALPGASGRGRMYWPATGVALQASDLRMAAATVSAALSAFKTFLSGADTAIEGVLGGPAQLAVWSRKLVDYNAVTSLQMGNITDVQRRRRDALIEGYTATTYP